MTRAFGGRFTTRYAEVRLNYVVGRIFFGGVFLQVLNEIWKQLKSLFDACVSSKQYCWNETGRSIRGLLPAERRRYRDRECGKPGSTKVVVPCGELFGVGIEEDSVTSGCVRKGGKALLDLDTLCISGARIRRACWHRRASEQKVPADQSIRIDLLYSFPQAEQLGLAQCGEEDDIASGGLKREDHRSRVVVELADFGSVEPEELSLAGDRAPLSD